MPRYTGDLDTTINGIPCQIRVISYRPGSPMRITGWGFGDAEPPEPEEIEWEVLDRRGYRARWLEQKLDDEEIQRIEAELLAAPAEAA